MADLPVHGLPDDDVEELIGRLEPLLEQIERATGPVAEVAAQAVEGLALMYGTALARVLTMAEGTPDLVRSLVQDQLVHHLLALHGLHPQPVRERVLRAIDDIEPRLRSRGGHVELIAVEDGVARLRWSAGGCGSTAGAVERAIGDAVLAAAPELRRVETVPAPRGRRPPAVIPAESLLRKPTTPAGPGGGPG
jgi:Fe-S cluster biogenesis protein NfuA